MDYNNTDQIYSIALERIKSYRDIDGPEYRTHTINLLFIMITKLNTNNVKPNSKIPNETQQKYQTGELEILGTNMTFAENIEIRSDGVYAFFKPHNQRTEGWHLIQINDSNKIIYKVDDKEYVVRDAGFGNFLYNTGLLSHEHDGKDDIWGGFQHSHEKQQHDFIKYAAYIKNNNIKLNDTGKLTDMIGNDASDERVKEIQNNRYLKFFTSDKKTAIRTMSSNAKRSVGELRDIDKDWRFVFENTNQQKYLYQDNETYTNGIKEFLDNSKRLVTNAIQSLCDENNMLVHCQAGMNRTGANWFWLNVVVNNKDILTNLFENMKKNRDFCSNFVALRTQATLFILEAVKQGVYIEPGVLELAQKILTYQPE